jgi:hypothetical protein
MPKLPENQAEHHNKITTIGKEYRLQQPIIMRLTNKTATTIASFVRLVVFLDLERLDT